MIKKSIELIVILGVILIFLSGIIGCESVVPNIEPGVPEKVYGFNFGPYTKNGQDPNYGTVISKEQIRELLTIIAPYTEWVRTFGCTNGLENIGSIAHELGLKVAAGAWLSENLSANEEQISNLINVAQAGEADMLIVGSEVMLRRDVSEEELVGYINRVREALPGIPVTTADIYGELLAHPAVMAAVDVVLVNIYPYWEGITVNKAIYNLNFWHQQIDDVSQGKEVIVSETGWPSEGYTMGDAIPSPENASFYFLNFVCWAKVENVSYFYFEAFDEPWKAGYEGAQGAHWGVWDKDGNLKPGMQCVFDGETMFDNWSDE
jgi:exo-beta-1,3-glucanase (GH17 family)